MGVKKMDNEVLRIVLIDSLGILAGFFLVVCAIVNPKKIIIGNLTESNFKDKKKFVYSKRILLLVIGLIYISIILLFWSNIVSKDDLGPMFSMPLLIMMIGTSIISKKYLVRKEELKNKDVEVPFCYYCGNDLNGNSICPSCGKKIEL